MRAAVVLALVLVACSGTGEPAEPASTATEREPKAPAQIVELDAGNFHTCVRLDDGQVECWGQCGRQCGMRPDGSTERMPVVGLADAVELAVSDSHACARLADGDVACWGSNYGGLLGRLEPEQSAMPLLVPDVHGAVEIAIGGSLTCVRQRSGTVTCWGQANGDYDHTPEAARARLPQRVEGVTDAQSIAVDSTGACARTAAGWSCWNWNAMAPDYVHRMGAARSDVRKSDVVQWTQGVCSCDLGTDGVVHCIGSGILSAQLADGSSPPVQLHECPADGLAGVRTLGDSCAVMIDGTLQCWGPTYVGRAGGPATFEDRRKPGPVDGITDVRTLAQGSSHTCVLTNAGDALCWGHDGQGQVDGKPTETAVWPPHRVAR